MIFGPRWPTWCGRRTPVSAGEGRTVAELLDDSDGLARETLLDSRRTGRWEWCAAWPQLIQSAAKLWAVLPPDPTVSANGDPIAILTAMGSAAGARPGRRTGRGGGGEMSRSHRTSCGPACFSNSLWHPRPYRPTARSTQPPLAARYCTCCMSPHTPQRWHSPGISVTCNIAGRLVRGDGNPWLSDLRRWRSSRRGA
jgi:hypothetical protein